MENFLKHLIGKLSIDATFLENGSGTKVAYVAHKSAAIHDLEQFADKPRRINTNKRFSNIAGFAAYLGDFGTDETRLFAQVEDRSVMANIDYHKDSSNPSWCKHNAHIEFALDKDYKAWLRIDDRSLTQRELVTFLMDYANDFITPDKAAVLEIVGNIQAVKTADLDSKVGNYDLNQVVKNSVKVKSHAGAIPEIFELALPILEGFDKYKVQFRIAIGVEDEARSASFKINLIRPHNIERNAFNDACHDIIKASDRKIYGFIEADVSEVQEA